MKGPQDGFCGRSGGNFCRFFMRCTVIYKHIIFHIDIIWYICGIINIREMAKVIHVHLVRPIEESKRRDWYFGSIKAVYSVFTAEQVGATYNYLRHAGLSGNGTVITKCAIIKQSTLISGHRNNS